MATGAIASVIIAGSSLVGTTANILLSSTDYKVACVMKVTNHTKWDLQTQNTNLNGGEMKESPQDIQAGYEEAAIFHKVAGTATGTSGTTSWYIDNDKDTELVVMWSVPFDHNLYSNYLAVGLMPKGTHAKHGSNMFDYMYYDNEALPKEMYERKEFSKDTSPVTFLCKEAGVIVKGVMGTAAKCTIEIAVQPLRDEDLCEQD